MGPDHTIRPRGPVADPVYTVCCDLNVTKLWPKLVEHRVGDVSRCLGLYIRV